MAHNKESSKPQYNTTKDRDSRKESFGVYKGIIFALLSSLLGSLTFVIVKYLINIHPIELSLYCLIATFAITLPQAVKCEEDLLGPKHFRFMLLFRSFIGATELLLEYVAFRYLTLGEAALIMNTNPIFVTIAAKILLKEPCTVFQSIAVVTAITGITVSTIIPKLISENADVYTTQSIYGLLSATGTLILCSFRQIVLRKLKTVHHAVSMLYYSVFAILEMVILIAIFGNFKLHSYGHQWLYIAAFCVCGYGAPALQTIAFQCEMAGPVSTISAASGTFLAFLFQVLLFNDIPDFLSSTGAVLVVVSIVFVSLQKSVSSLNENSLYRKKTKLYSGVIIKI